MNSSELLTGLDEGTLDPAAFDHRANITVAWEALGRDDFFRASARVADGIRKLAEAAGATDKFNATITQAYMCAIAERRARDDAPDAHTFMARHPDLADGRFLKALFSTERLGDPLARHVPLLPVASKQNAAHQP